MRPALLLAYVAVLLAPTTTAAPTPKVQRTITDSTLVVDASDAGTTIALSRPSSRLTRRDGTIDLGEAEVRPTSPCCLHQVMLTRNILPSSAAPRTSSREIRAWPRQLRSQHRRTSLPRPGLRRSLSSTAFRWLGGGSHRRGCRGRLRYLFVGEPGTTRQDLWRVRNPPPWYPRPSTCAEHRVVGCETEGHAKAMGPKSESHREPKIYRQRRQLVYGQDWLRRSHQLRRRHDLLRLLEGRVARPSFYRQY